MRTPQCQTAIDRLVASVGSAAPQHDEVEAALQHIRECSDCQHNAGELIEAVTGLTCEECQDRLPNLLLLERESPIEDSQWRAVKLHLQICRECPAAYHDLADLLALANGERGEQPPAYPAPRLPFLRSETSSSPQRARISWHLDQLGRLLITISDELLRPLRTPTLQPAYATGRKVAGASPILWQVTMNEVDDLAVTITAERSQSMLDQCTLVVEAIMTSRGGWPNLAGIDVTLWRNDREVAKRKTDAFGKVIFQDIPTTDLSQLAITVQTGES